LLHPSIKSGSRPFVAHICPKFMALPPPGAEYANQMNTIQKYNTTLNQNLSCMHARPFAPSCSPGSKLKEANAHFQKMLPKKGQSKFPGSLKCPSKF